MRLTYCVLIVCMLVLGACASGPSTLPGHLEPHHHVRLQNGYARVLETVIDPGESTHDHSHAIEAAIIVLRGGELRITNDDDSARDVSLERGQVMFGDSAIVHRVANTGTTAVRVVSVEIFSRPPERGASPPIDAPGEVLIDNDKVVVSRIRIPPHEWLGLPSAGPSVLVAAGPGRLESEDRRLSLDLGRAVWHEADDAALRNAGSGTLEAYVVTIKPRS